MRYTLENLDRMGDEAFELERDLAHLVSSPLRNQADLALADAVILWTNMLGDVREVPTGVEATALIVGLTALVDQVFSGSVGVDTLTVGMHQAVHLGVDQAVGITGTTLAVGSPAPDLAPVDAAPDILDRHETAARSMLSPALLLAMGFAGVMSAFAEGNKAANDLGGLATWGVNANVSLGVHHVADVMRVGRVWVPERDACVHCAGYAGEVAETNDVFTEGLTFGEKPLRVRGLLEDPPLHPNCRCRTAPWSETMRVSPVDVPEALRREAKRSILKGWAMESEPAEVRARAAERLLRRGAGMPASVEQAARRKLRRGTFRTRPFER